MTSGPDVEESEDWRDSIAPEWLDELDTGAPLVDAPAKLNGHVRVDDRPEVKLGTDLHRVLEDVSAALAKDPLVYHRAHELVTVVGAPRVVDGVPITRGTPTIRPLNPPALLPRLTRFVKILSLAKPSPNAIKLAKLKGEDAEPEWREVMAPPAVVSSLLACADWEDIRPLMGISETPFFRPDGTICQATGYDAATGYICAPSVHYPPVPSEPSQAEARTSLLALIDVFSEFPHVSDAARLVPIAAILTILARPAISGAIPAFVFDASTRGSGKTLQAHAISMVTLGRFASPCTFPSDDEELEKILSGYAIAGSRIVLLDNITRPFGGAPLDKCLTARGDVDLRVLGSTEIRRLAWNAIVLASGNNVSLPEDTMRRVLVSRVESPLENPEDRTDVRDLPAFIFEHRGELVVHALTVLRAYAFHGYPDAGLAKWGSFEEWSRLIPHALKFAGGDDVLDARPRGEAAATDEMGALSMLLRRLPSLSADPMTAKNIVQALWPAGRDSDAPPDMWDDLRDAIETLAPPRIGRVPSPKALGEKMRKMAGRVLNGKRLMCRTIHDNTRGWYVD